MRYKVSKTEYEKLSDEAKGEYRLVGDTYVLEVEGLDTKAADKFTAERDKRRAAEDRATKAEAKITELEDQFSDTTTAIKTANDKVTKAEQELVDARDVHNKYVRTTLLDKEADTLASEVSTAPKILLPHITSRLDVDITDPAAPKLVYKDKDGKPGAKRDDVLKDFRDNKDFAAIIKGSQASGGNASRRTDTGGNGHTGPTGFHQQQPGGQVADLNRASSADLVSRVNARRVAAGQEAL